MVVGQKKVPDKLVDPSSVTNLHRITPRIGCVTTGLPADAAAQISRARQEAADFLFKNGYEVPVSYLAKRLATVNQIYTQHASMRALGVMLILVGVDKERGPQVYRVDPAGLYRGYKGTAAGVKETAAMNYLEKRLKDAAPSDKAGTIELAILSLQSALAVEFKASDIEVGIVDGEDGTFETLKKDAIEDHLQAIAERD